MSFKRLVSYQASDTADAVVKIKDQMLSMGWTMHDDMSGEAKPYYVFQSLGEDSTATLIPMYMRIGEGTTVNNIDFRGYLYWDSGTHTGIVEFLSYTFNQIFSDDDAPFYIWVYGCKDWLVIISKVVSTYYGSFVNKITSPTNSIIATLKSNSGTGTDKVLELGSGEADPFITGRNIGIVCIDGTVGRQYTLTISDVDRVNDTITISTSISYDFPAGSIVGHQPCPWVKGSMTDLTNCCLMDGSGTTTQALKSTLMALFNVSNFDPEEITNLYGLIPLIVHKSSAFWGILEKGFFGEGLPVTYEDTLVTGKKEDGIVSSSTDNTIDSTGENWITNEFAGKAIVITSGFAIGQEMTILSNTDVQIVVDENWITNPSNGDAFDIANKSYRHFGWPTKISVQECGEFDI